MRAQTKQAGPGLDRGASLPVPLEAAGPASPRLTIEEVRAHLGPDRAEVTSTLALGGGRYDGRASAPTRERPIWQLAAAASVAAIQQCLQQTVADLPAPQAHLLDATLFTTGIGQEVVAATVRLTHHSSQVELHGSALVRTDRPRAAVAAALDAVARYLGRLRTQQPNQSPCLASAGRESTDAVTPDLDPLSVVPELSDDADAGLVDDMPDTPGRRSHDAAGQSVGELAPKGFPSLGLTISPTVIHAVAVDARGGVLAEARRPIGGGVLPQDAIASAVHAAREVVASLNGAGKLTAIGVASPIHLLGADDSSPTGIDGWRHETIAAPLASELALPVAVISPAHAAAYAEFTFGAARGIPDLLYVRVGAGIDAALMLSGRPALTQLASGQAGHIVIESGGVRCACGESGCWQALAGTDALVARAARGSNSEEASLTPAAIVRMANAGDPVCRRALDDTGNYLGLGLANLIALLGPQVVIVESLPAVVGAALLRAAEASLKSAPRAALLSHCVLLSPELGESSVAMGAAAWAARGGA